MSSDKAVSISFEKKVKAVETYLATGKSLRKIARDMSIPYQTLWEWVKLYREGGKEKFREKRVHKRRVSKDIEMKVMYLKEQNPSLSIKKAQHVLRKQVINLSPKGIWQIWKRYGLAKRSIQDPLNPFCAATPESDDGIRQAKAMMHKGNLKEAAKILNGLPCLPEDPIIEQIPEKLLSPRRMLDRLYIELGKIPFPEYERKVRRIGKILEVKGYIYSSITADFLELTALGWAGKPEEAMIVLGRLAKKMRHVKNNALWFLFYFNQVVNYCRSLQISKALGTIKKCRRFVYALPYSFYQDDFGTLLAFLGKYKEATPFIKMALKNEKNQEVAERYALRLAFLGHEIAGEYADARKMLTKAQAAKDFTGLGASYSLAQAYLSFGQGNLAQATRFYLESLEKSTKGELYNLIYGTSVGLAGVAMALNKKKEAKMYLKKYLPLMKKCGLPREELVLKQLFGSGEPIPDELLHMPPLRLLNLLLQASRTLKIGDYRKALNFAQRQKLLGIFHRWIVFFSAPVIHLLEKGKQSGLPKALLKFPIFNQNTPVYHIKFLGDVVISKNQHYVRTKPSPQEKAFLIYLALRAGAPGKFILLNDLNQNFWPKSTKPLNRLLHLLARLKKKLMLPGHLLSISSSHGEPRLINRGIYITTDYDEFETLLTQVKSLKRADEWLYAQKDYLRAFALIRGEPFKKMYDNWSERMRGVILNKVEDEAIHFAQGCLGYDKKTTPRFVASARKVLEKVNGLIPHSQDVKKLLTEL